MNSDTFLQKCRSIPPLYMVDHDIVDGNDIDISLNLSIFSKESPDFQYAISDMVLDFLEREKKAPKSSRHCNYGIHYPNKFVGSDARTDIRILRKLDADGYPEHILVAFDFEWGKKELWISQFPADMQEIQRHASEIGAGFQATRRFQNSFVFFSDGLQFVDSFQHPLVNKLINDALHHFSHGESKMQSIVNDKRFAYLDCVAYPSLRIWEPFILFQHRLNFYVCFAFELQSLKIEA